MDRSPLLYILMVKGVHVSSNVTSTMMVKKAFAMSSDVGARDVNSYLEYVSVLVRTNHILLLIQRI